VIASLALAALTQAPPAVSYGLVLVRQADTVAIERVTRDAAGLREEILVPGRARLLVVALTDADGCVASATVSVFPWGSAPGVTPVQRVSVWFDGDSLRVDAAARGMTQKFARPRAGARFIMPGEAVAASALVLECGGAGERDSADVHTWLFPNLRPMTVRLRAAGDSLLVVTSDSSWAVREGGQLVRFRIGRDGLIAHRVPIAALDRIAFAAPDYSAPGGAPYRAETVSVRVNDAVILAGTLTVPSGTTRPVPAVVTISGTGAQDRDSYAPIAEGWRPFRELADTLGRRGVAVLRLDDRGTGSSTGDQGVATELTAVEDARAALAWLRARPGIAPDRLVLLGHSEGVRIAMLAAADEPDLAGLVLLSGAADTRAATLAQALWAAEHGPAAGRVPRDTLVARLNRMMDSLAITGTREVFRWQPAPLAARIRAPVAIFHGGADRQVPAAQADSLAAVFRRAGNRQVTVRIFSERNHLLVPDPDGDFLRYDRLPSARLGEDVKGAVADWISYR
jgi:dienelactone hydrolase